MNMIDFQGREADDDDIIDFFYEKKEMFTPCTYF